MLYFYPLNELVSNVMPATGPNVPTFLEFRLYFNLLDILVFNNMEV